MTYRISFTSWYLNADRISQLLRLPDSRSRFPTHGQSTAVLHAESTEGRAIRNLNAELEDWLATNTVPSLAQLMLDEERIESGDLFVIHQDFYGRGLSKYSNSSKPAPRDASAEIYCKLGYADKTLRIIFSPFNLTSVSAWSRLGGHTKLFAFCYIESVTDTEIIARPYMIGDFHADLVAKAPSMFSSAFRSELHVSQIDQFAKVRSVHESELRAPSLLPLKSIPEHQIKAAIIDMLGEEIIPKDWGGEQSDVFTTNTSVDNRPVTSAFLLKGPAKFSEMRMNHLGKNGDQIVRLYDEPADLLILQHCHKVSSAVRKTMRAFAETVQRPRQFVIIDGYDTMRLLKAYGKCGQ